MRVNLLFETPSRDCGCASLLEHWESACHQKAHRCSVATCTMPAGDAVVVRMEDESDPNRYVVPVCRGHAIQKNPTLELRTGSQLVSYSLLGTCTHRLSARAAT